MPPPPIDLGADALDVVSAGSASFCAILEDHRVVCWGRRVFGHEQPLTWDVGDEPGEMPPPALRLYG